MASAQATTEDEWLAAARHAADLSRTGRTIEAEAAYRKVLADAGRLRVDGATVALLWSDFATLEWKEGHLEQAEHAHKTSLAELERSRPDDARMALLSAELLNFYARTNQLGKAERFEKQCRESSWWNSSSREMAHMLNAVGMLSCKQRRFDEAETHLKRALAIERQGKSPDPSLRDQAEANLGAVYLGASRPEDAIRLFRAALEHEESRFGAGSPALIPYLNDLAMSYSDSGHVPEAAKAMERALTIADAALPKDHPIRAGLLENYSRILMKLHRGRESRIAAKQAREIAHDGTGGRASRSVVDISDLAKASVRP